MHRGVIITALCINLCCAQERKTIILWDLHEVIFNQKNPISTLLQSPHLRRIIANVSWSLMKDLILELMENIVVQKSTEDYLHITRKHNNTYLDDAILAIANTLYVIPGMDQLIYELAQQGYTQHIGSNIGPRAFQNLINPQLYPKFSSIFDKIDIAASQIAEYHNGKLIQKPDPHFYQLYLEKNNLDPLQDHIIFIDDNANNIRIAKQLGFDAILFKHPYQVRTELQRRGIAIAPPPYTISNQNTAHILYNPSQYIRSTRLR